MRRLDLILSDFEEYRQNMIHYKNKEKEQEKIIERIRKENKDTMISLEISEK